MKLSCGRAFLACWLLGVAEQARAGEFINLNFEQADLSGSLLEYRTIPELAPRFPLTDFPFGTGPAALLLPGWSVFYGDLLPDNSMEYILADTIPIGNGDFDAPNLGPHPGQAGLIVTGNYVELIRYDGFALVLDDNARLAGGSPDSMRVSQLGTVPLDALLLSFRLPRSGAISLLVDGNFYPVNTLARDPADISGYLFDISPWAGREIELGFETSGGAYYVVDDISFVIPEPSTVALFFLGGAALLCRCGKRRRHFSGGRKS